MPSSVNSQRSGSSGKVRPIPSRNAQVDETLFGRRKSQPGLGNKNSEEIEKIAQQVRNGTLKTSKAIVIPQTELLRMKNAAIVMTKEDQLNQKRLAEEQNEKMMATAKAKKQRMMEMEVDRKKNSSHTEGEPEEKERGADNFLGRAQAIMDERRDAVKQMNQLIMQAKVVTIRDKQLEEKKDIREHKNLEEKRRDLMMEVERLKKIKQHDEEERKHKEIVKQESLVVVDQIREREYARLKVQEEKEREAQEMLRLIRQKQIEEEQKNLKKKALQKDLLDQISAANQNSIATKHGKIVEAKIEDDKIHKYNVEKAQKEAEYIAEQKRIKDEKEKEL